MRRTTEVTEATHFDEGRVDLAKGLHRRGGAQGVEIGAVEIARAATVAAYEMMMPGEVGVEAGPLPRGAEGGHEAEVGQAPQGAVHRVEGERGQALPHAVEDGFSVGVVVATGDFAKYFNALMGELDAGVPADALEMGELLCDGVWGLCHVHRGAKSESITK